MSFELLPFNLFQRMLGRLSSVIMMCTLCAYVYSVQRRAGHFMATVSISSHLAWSKKFQIPQCNQKWNDYPLHEITFSPMVIVYFVIHIWCVKSFEHEKFRKFVKVVHFQGLLIIHMNKHYININPRRNFTVAPVIEPTNLSFILSIFWSL